MRRIALFFCFITVQFTSFTSFGASNLGYFGFEPDITTNYIGSSKKKLGFVRVTVELMILDMNNLEVVEHHVPLLRDAIVEILSKEPEDKVKSLVGREEIRKKCAQAIKKLLKIETGQEIIRDVLFTKYLYN
ncbi:flagellar basal body-associated protein FliL [Pseudoalteromonas denitrificans]|jgi:flagellar FliL protein|uniref:Flagellar protein FliL n=1 Tax=Pseudoalteromonas denitrificans DSM 6059 TaxID=1123010 RepID=A0A1I1DUY4_9GAMM|nr:flagellar basal body-associated protein FliL [Pseudoalteromonas denitrificans]SFB78775.1 flagellar FliL protein [Pseudoalteromonas denitrificans DSM 6059]